MIVGDPGAWADRFRSLDERLLERIVAVWPQCLTRLPGQPIEDDITINLVDLLWNHDSVARSLCHWIEYQFEPFGIDPDGAPFSKGKIDLAVLLDQDRERYLAYECKRLNVIGKNGRASLATDYVAEGMKRFVTEKYAEALPIGAMLGYVMDGDIAFARARVEQAIASHVPLNTSSEPVALGAIGIADRFLTSHARNSGENIELLHALLPYN